MKMGGLVLAGLFTVAGGPANAEVILQIANNFSETGGGTYFGGHIEDQDISLYFTGVAGSEVTYNGSTPVTAGSQIRLSSVTDGKFSMDPTVNAARVYAILGNSAPATIPVASGPDPVLVTYPYSFIELSTIPGGKADQSFLNQVSFPTKLSNGTDTNSWSPSATPLSVATAFHTAHPSAPYAPAAGVVHGSQLPYNPYAATTVTRSAGADQTPISGHRVIAASNPNNPAASAATNTGTGYTNVRGFNSYLGWLKDHQPGEGWKFGYNSPGFSGSTYVGFLKVTGSNDNFGLELSDFTYGGTFTPEGNMTGGTSVTGTITYAANNSTQSVYGDPYTGNWTDMTLFGATDPTGTAVTVNGNIGSLSSASVLYTVSASIGAGILGSDAYVAHDRNTDFFFKSGLTSANILSDFFAHSEFDHSKKIEFYDQNWYTMLLAGGVDGGLYAGYFTPYDDHFDGLDVLMASDSGTLTWDLGLANLEAVPEPGTASLLAVGLAGLAAYARRRRRIAA